MDRKLTQQEIERIKSLNLSSRGEIRVMNAWREVPSFPPFMINLFIGVFVASFVLLASKYFGLIVISQELYSFMLGISWMFHIFLVIEISTIKSYLKREDQDWLLTPDAMKTWRLGIGPHTRTVCFGLYGFFLSSIDMFIAIIFLFTVLICYFNYIFVREKVEEYIQQIQ